MLNQIIVLFIVYVRTRNQQLTVVGFGLSSKDIRCIPFHLQYKKAGYDLVYPLRDT